MARHIIRKLEPEENQFQWGPRPLPVDKPYAIWARQSTTRQVEQNTESTELQTKGLLKRARDLHYDESLGTLYQEGDGIRGVSGRLRIDQRSDLAEAVTRIQREELKTVFILNEGRLFRDPTGIQYNTFSDICMRHDCLVITPYHIYDFAHSSDDLNMWQQRCEAEADYIEYHVKMMHAARRQAAMRGEYACGVAPIGYIVDYQKDSPTYMKLVPYRPHAEIICWIFRRFKELDGRLNALVRELQQMGVVFPATDFPLNTRLKKVAGGWKITRDGLIYLLTNPIYIGHWTVGDKRGRQIVKKYNHEAIVSEDDFFYAYNRLSDVDLDGNPQERIGAPPVRFRQLTTLPCDALLEDRIESEDCPVYVHRTKKAYIINDVQDGLHVSSAAIKIAALDTEFSKRFTYVVKMDKKMRDGTAYAVIQQAQQEQATISVEDQLRNVTRQIALLRAKMDKTHDIQQVRKWKTELRELTQLQPQLEKLLMRRDDSIKTEQDYKTLLDRIGDEWGRMSFEQKKKAVNTLIDKAVLTKEAPHWYRLVIHWRVPVGRVDEGHIWYRHGGGFIWTDEEEEALGTLYPSAPRGEVQKALSRRTWNDICDHASEHRIRRVNRSESTLPDAVAMDDLLYAQEHDLNTYAGEEVHTSWRALNDERSAYLCPYDKNT